VKVVLEDLRTMFWVTLVVGTLLIGSVGLGFATPCFAQESRSDTTKLASPTDSIALKDSLTPADTVAQASSADTASADTASVDTASADTAARATADSAALPQADTARAPPDTLPKVPAGSAPTRTTPADSTLLAACAGSSGAAPGVASGLLLVIFAPGSSAEARSAAAESVHGRLVPQPGSEGFNAYYLLLPNGGTESELRAVADQLVQFPEIQQVGTKTCPAPH
jgi:cytoskeletal protein RodZ